MIKIKEESECSAENADYLHLFSNFVPSVSKCTIAAKLVSLM